MTEEINMNVGVQPLDAIMTEKGIKNHDLVNAAMPGFITHKQVQKARKGRRLTMHMQEKILEALNAFAKPESYAFKDLFNYRGKKSISS
jgi:DNA-binding Xre family transcriptional regulator